MFEPSSDRSAGDTARPVSANPPATTPLKPSDCVQFLEPQLIRGRRPRTSKLFEWQADHYAPKAGYDKNAKWFRSLPPVEAAEPEMLLAALGAASSRGELMILGTPNVDDPRVREQLERTGYLRRTKVEKIDKNGDLQLPSFVECPRRCFMIDFDLTDIILNHFRQIKLDLYRDPIGALRYVRDTYLPGDIARATLVCNFSSSAGLGVADHGRDGAVIRVHFFCILEQPMMPHEFKRLILAQNQKLAAQGWGKEKNKPFDLSLYQAVQPHYVADPRKASTTTSRSPCSGAICWCRTRQSDQQEPTLAR